MAWRNYFAWLESRNHGYWYLYCDIKPGYPIPVCLFREGTLQKWPVAIDKAHQLIRMRVINPGFMYFNYTIRPKKVGRPPEMMSFLNLSEAWLSIVFFLGVISLLAAFEEGEVVNSVTGGMYSIYISVTDGCLPSIKTLLDMNNRETGGMMMFNKRRIDSLRWREPVPQRIWEDPF